MKRFFLAVVLILIIIYTCFSQAIQYDGYDDLPWGTTIDEFRKLNPSAYEHTTADDKLKDCRVFLKKESL